MTYRIFGAEVSPYSVKVRSYFRYKGLDHEWIVRDQNAMPEFQKHAKLPLIPLVLAPDGKAMQDSTPIIEQVEAAHPEPSIHPDEPTTAFLSALIEEFADEWGNKWMFHYRWAREIDQQSVGRRLAQTMLGDADDATLEATAQGIVQRMVGRTWFVGSNERTAPQIEESYVEALGQLEAHLANRPYLFGSRPSFGDLGLWGQLYNAWTDPTAGGLMRDGHPNVLAWIERMLEPEAVGDGDGDGDGDGEWEGADALLPTLEPFLARQVGGRFLPWSDANARAIADGAEEFDCTLLGQTWTQKPQKYHARSLTALRAKYTEVADDPALADVLERTGCRSWLTA